MRLRTRVGELEASLEQTRLSAEQTRAQHGAEAVAALQARQQLASVQMALAEKREQLGRLKGKLEEAQLVSAKATEEKLARARAATEEQRRRRRRWARRTRSS